MKKIWLLSFVFIVIFISVSCEKEKETYSELEKEVLALINAHRIEQGLSELEMNKTIWEEARGHSKNMASENIPFGHDGFFDRSDRIIAAIPGVNATAENIIAGPNDVQVIVDGWLTSPDHKNNIEGDYNLTGVGIAVDGSNSYYCTQIFAKQQ